MKLKKILIVRSAARIFDKTLDSLKSEFPNSEVTAIVPFPLLETIKNDNRINDIVPVDGKGQLSIFKINPAQRIKLKERNFDIGVSLYNYEHGLGYSNIDLINWALKIKELRGYNVNGKCTILKPKDVFLKVIQEKTNFIWIPLNWAMIFILFSIITLGIAGEWFLRKIVGRIAGK